MRRPSTLLRPSPSTRPGDVAASLGAGSGSGSSSNGRSNRSLICGELGELVLTVTQSLDVCRTSRGFVDVDDDGVEPRVSSRDVESSWQAGQKAVERRLDLDADDRVVRPRHAG